MKYVEKMRERLRIKNDSLNAEISDNIDSAILEMNRVGIEIKRDYLDNKLLFTCVEFYCKWLMNFEAEGEKFEAAYEKLRDSLAASGKEDI